MKVCYLCGYEINGNLDPRNPASKTMDHVKPRCKGGKQAGNLRPAHRICNITKADRYPVTDALKSECADAYRQTKAFRKVKGRRGPFLKRSGEFCIGEAR